MHVRLIRGAPLLFVALALAVASSGPATGPAGAGPAQPQVLQPVPDSDGTEQDPAAVARVIEPLATAKVMGKQAATVVVDAASGKVLYDDDGGTGLVPASTNKIPTAIGAIRAYRGDERLRTRVTAAGDTIYLVGAGDPLLASRKPQPETGQPDYPSPTSLQALVRRTAAALKSRGSLDVVLKFDDSLFSGPDWGPEWPEYYRTSGIVSPVSALMVDDGRVGGQWGPKVEDPALAAAQRFAELLRGQGIAISGVKRGTSPDGAAEVAAVESVPVNEIAGQALTYSDNDTAEALFRLAGIGAGYGGSFAGGSRAVREALESLDVSTIGAEFADGSGLSQRNRLPAKALTEMMRRAVAGTQGLWPVASGLAVAGVTGTLRYRFVAPETADAAGWVRGKTGTLNYVSSLAGYVQSASGRVLVFAAIANEAKSSSDAAATIDKIAARIADCGCPGEAR